jgi:hypothetical protein
MSELLTSTVTARASNWTSTVLARVNTFDHREFWHTSALLTLKVTKTILRAREVLECLSNDLVLLLEHSIFLRPTKFASLFIVRHSLNSRSKEYNHFNHLSLQCLHMSLLLNITSKGNAINFVSSLWANTAWACDLNHFNTGEFNPWL